MLKDLDRNRDVLGQTRAKMYNKHTLHYTFEIDIFLCQIKAVDKKEKLKLDVKRNFPNISTQN